MDLGMTPDVVTPGRLEFFIAAKLTNPLNGSHGHWSKHARLAKQYRNAVSTHVLALCRTGGWTVTAPPSSPKRLTFTLHVPRGFDSDAWPSIAKPFRDGCMDAGLIHDDGPNSGHEFIYAQIKDGRRGVTVRVEAA